MVRAFCCLLLVAVFVELVDIGEVEVLFVEVVFVNVYIVRRFALVGVGVAGVLGFRGQGGHLGVALFGFPKQFLKVRSIHGNLVSHELKRGSEAGSDIPSNLLPKHTLGLLQSLGSISLNSLIPKNGVVDGGMLKIIGHPGISNSNPLNPGILNLPPQSLSNYNLNPLR